MLSDSHTVLAFCDFSFPTDGGELCFSKFPHLFLEGFLHVHIARRVSELWILVPLIGLPKLSVTQILFVTFFLHFVISLLIFNRFVNSREKVSHFTLVILGNVNKIRNSASFYSAVARRFKLFLINSSHHVLPDHPCSISISETCRGHGFLHRLDEFRSQLNSLSLDPLGLLFDGSKRLHFYGVSFCLWGEFVSFLFVG